MRLTQEQLSERSGVPRDYIANLERGASVVPREPDHIRALAKVLGVKMREIAEPTGWYDEIEGEPRDWRSELMADPRLDDSAKQALMRIIDALAEEPAVEPKKRAG